MIRTSDCCKDTDADKMYSNAISEDPDPISPLSLPLVLPIELVTKSPLKASVSNQTDCQ